MFRASRHSSRRGNSRWRRGRGRGVAKGVGIQIRLPFAAVHRFDLSDILRSAEILLPACLAPLGAEARSGADGSGATPLRLTAVSFNPSETASAKRATSSADTASTSSWLECSIVSATSFVAVKPAAEGANFGVATGATTTASCATTRISACFACAVKPPPCRRWATSRCPPGPTFRTTAGCSTNTSTWSPCRSSPAPVNLSAAIAKARLPKRNACGQPRRSAGREQILPPEKLAPRSDPVPRPGRSTRRRQDDLLRLHFLDWHRHIAHVRASARHTNRHAPIRCTPERTARQPVPRSIQAAARFDPPNSAGRTGQCNPCSSPYRAPR